MNVCMNVKSHYRQY